MLNNKGIGALILRITLGVIFLAHGTAKFQGGIENTVGWFESIGLPGFMAYAVAVIEVVGGIALIVGLGTRIVSALFALLLIGAIIKVKFAAGFLNGYAYDLVLLSLSVSLFVEGSKLYSIGNLLFNQDKETNRYSKSA
ncbi:DoxX family protein [Domibacillus tundrae]|uniref:DoxX family protein n=1 Tax=Domibacillus tundrae TaxID=1587527 RepID=UPI000617C52F|nr:DoxX family protein [Domibacillus tundrae]